MPVLQTTKKIGVLMHRHILRYKSNRGTSLLYLLYDSSKLEHRTGPTAVTAGVTAGLDSILWIKQEQNPQTRDIDKTSDATTNQMHMQFQ